MRRAIVVDGAVRARPGLPGSCQDGAVCGDIVIGKVDRRLGSSVPFNVGARIGRGYDGPVWPWQGAHIPAVARGNRVAPRNVTVRSFGLLGAWGIEGNGCLDCGVGSAKRYMYVVMETT